jgi:hypothetical protein
LNISVIKTTNYGIFERRNENADDAFTRIIHAILEGFPHTTITVPHHMWITDNSNAVPERYPQLILDGKQEIDLSQVLSKCSRKYKKTKRNYYWNSSSRNNQKYLEQWPTVAEELPFFRDVDIKDISTLLTIPGQALLRKSSRGGFYTLDTMDLNYEIMSYRLEWNKELSAWVTPPFAKPTKDPEPVDELIQNCHIFRNWISFFHLLKLSPLWKKH